MEGRTIRRASRFSEEQLIHLVQQAECGEQAIGVRCREHGLSEQTFDHCLKGTPLKGLTVMDEVTREGLAIEVATSLPAPRVLAVLERLVARHGTPPCIRSDHGPECIALAVRGWLARHQMTTLDIAPGSPWQNGYGERFNGTVRDECVHMHIFHSVAEGRVVLDIYRRQYHAQRPHSSVSYRTPAEVTREWLERQLSSVGLSHFPWPRLLGACHPTLARPIEG